LAAAVIDTGPTAIVTSVSKRRMEAVPSVKRCQVLTGCQGVWSTADRRAPERSASDARRRVRPASASRLIPVGTNP